MENTNRRRADSGLPTFFRFTALAVPIAEDRHHNRAAGYCTALASVGLPTVLAMEITLARRPVRGPDRGPQPDPADEPWRVAEAWDRGGAVDGRQVHGQAPTPRVG